MKDNKEDDTVRYKNTYESLENSSGNNNISDEKNIKIIKEENKNIIDKLYDCGDELSLEDYNLNNYSLNEINKELNKEDNSNKKERYNLNMNMFKFFDNDDYIDVNNKINVNNKEQQKEKSTSNENMNTNNINNSTEKENKYDIDIEPQNEYMKNEIEINNLRKLNNYDEIKLNQIDNEEDKFNNILYNKKIIK